MSSNHQKAVAKGRGSLAINAAQYANVTVYQYVTYAGDRVSVRETIDPSRCPYPGLETFRTSEAKYFAGREDDVAELEAKLRDHDICGVIAASGAGKSSLVHAGLIPALAERETEAWDVFAFKPGQEPLYGLARSMSGVLAEAETRRGQFDEIDATVADLRETPGRLRRYIQAIASRRVEAADGKHHHVLIFVDQWEELYTRENDEDRDILVRELMDVAERGLAKVLLTMRIDFMDDLVSKSTEFYDVLEPAVRILRPLGETGRRAAIEKPAEVAGLRVPPELTSRLVADLGKDEGTLPYLQFVLRQLWEKRDKETNSLTTATYDSMDGLKGAIGAHADDVFRKLSKEEQGLAQRVLPRLANVSDIGITSRRLPFADFDESARKLLRRLAEPDARLIVLSSATEDVAEAEIVAEVAHEALLDDWKTLSGWIEDRKDFFRLRNKLEADAKTWIENDKNPEFLIPSGKPLLDAQDLQTKALPSDFSAALDAFISMSVEKKKQDDKRRQDEEAARRKAEAEQLQKEKEQALERERLATELSQTESARANEAEESERTLKTRNKWLMGLAAVSVTVAVGAGYFWNQSILARGVAEKARLDAEANAARAELATQEADKQRNTADMERVAAEQSAREAEEARAQAEVQRDIARETAEEAKGRQLAYEAEDILKSDLTIQAAETAAALAIESWEMYPNVLAFQVANSAYKRLPYQEFDMKGTVGENVVRFGPNNARLYSRRASKFLETPTFSEMIVLEREGYTEIWRGRYDTEMNSRKFSPDGKYVALSFSDSTVRILETTSYSEVVPPMSGHGVFTMFFTEDAVSLVVSDDKNAVNVFNWRESELTARIQIPEFSDEYLRNAFPSDSTELLGLVSNNGRARVVSLPEGRTLKQFDKSREIFSLAISSDDDFVASGDRRGLLRVESLDDDSEKKDIQVDGAIYSLKFSPDGRWLAINSFQKLSVMDWRAGETVLSRTVDVSWANLDFSEDGTLLFFGSTEGAYVFRLTDGENLFAIEPGGTVRFDASEKTISTFDEDKVYRFFDVEAQSWKMEGEPTDDFDGGLRYGTASPNGAYVAFSWDSEDRKKVRILDAISGSEIYRSTSFEYITEYVFDQKGDRAFIVGDNGIVRVVGLKTGSEVNGFSELYSNLSVGGESYFVAVHTQTGSLVFVDYQTGSFVGDQVYFDEVVTKTQMSSSGAMVAVASQTADFSHVGLYQAPSGRKLLRVEHSGFVDIFEFDPLERWLAVGDTNGFARVIRVSDGTELWSHQFSRQGVSIDFNKSGGLLAVASGDGKVIVVDTNSWTQVSFSRPT